LAEYSLLERPDGAIVPYAGNEDALGRRFKLDDATWRGSNPKKKFTWRGATPSRNREWMYDEEEMEQALAKGELYLRDPIKGAARCKKSYLDINKGIYLQDIWTDAGRMKGGSSYATEKPEPLVERIVKSCTARWQSHPRLLLRLRHYCRRRRKAQPPLDRLRPGPLRHPHHA
jgi:hypothetical protein